MNHLITNNFFRRAGILFFLLAYAITAFSQRSVSGIVRDAESSLPGVSVLIKGTARGTITDAEGRYTIMVSEGEVLSYSFIGYETYEVEYDGVRDVIDVQLVPRIEELEELVVVGYGTQRKKDLTGAVGVVDVDRMKKQQSPTIGQSLQGQVPGVTVTTSGRPGSVADIRIRGIGSFSNVGPLYVVDGMILEGAQREFNVNDVESIQVLKDASATALYGSRGANGVIIITTRKGVSGAPKINFSSSYGLQQIARRLDMANSIEFLRVNRMAYENAGKIWPGEPAQGDTLVNTDWQDEFFKTGSTQDYNLTVSGGNELGNYLISGNAFLQDGVVYGPKYDRYNIRVNSEMKKGILTIGENILAGRTYTRPLNGVPFIDLARMPPVIPVYDENNESGYGYGSNAYQTYGSNPIGLQDNLYRIETGNRLIGNVYAELQLFSFLKYKLNAGLEYFTWHDREEHRFNQIRYLSQSSYENQVYENRGDFSSYLMENTLEFNKVFNDHRINALAGYTSQQTISKGISGSVYNVVDGYWVLSSGNTEPNAEGTDSEYAMISFLGRINYAFREKYLFQLNYRRDGSSRFGFENRYGNFPSGSFGWRISEEDFFAGAKDIVSNLKLRISYGVIGDQQALGNYDYTTYINVSEGGIFGVDQKYYGGAIQKGRENPFIKWETRTTFNVGADFGLFQNQLYGSVEYFNSVSSDLLVQIPTSWTDGTDITPWTNYGKINNQGLELTFGYKENLGDFWYDANLNLTFIKSIVLELGDSFREAGLNNVNRSEKGRSIGDFYVIRTEGIFQSIEEVYDHAITVTDTVTGEDVRVLIQPDARPGDIRYTDFNNDGIINADDRQYVGSPLPKFEGALSFSGGYKNFDVTLFITGVYGNKIYNDGKFWLERMDDVGNFPAGLEPWTKENPSTTTPRAFIGPNDNAKANTERWIEDGSYLRLKNLQIGYSIPLDRIRGRLPDSELLRVYIGTQNLFTITKYSGYDPEISGGSVFAKGNDSGHFPPVRTFLAGIQFNF
ncbi:MAG: TonB-dependent receptor [Bacteroidales bacterium]|nr:TonB-dependent receptor [Bacteroidales bacterium]MBN2698902.1 TonB-dependent receptor [Bacteroidales bacterium]